MNENNYDKSFVNLYIICKQKSFVNLYITVNQKDDTSSNVSLFVFAEIES